MSAPSFSQLATRAIDHLDRQWALTTTGVWACLGHAITVDSPADLMSTYGVREWL